MIDTSARGWTLVLWSLGVHGQKCVHGFHLYQTAVVCAPFPGHAGYQKAHEGVGVPDPCCYRPARMGSRPQVSLRPSTAWAFLKKDLMFLLDLFISRGSLCIVFLVVTLLQIAARES